MNGYNDLITGYIEAVEASAVAADAPDFTVLNEGTIVLFYPLNAQASAWIDENVHAESWQWFGGGLAVEHRYALPLAEALQSEGFTLEVR